MVVDAGTSLAAKMATTIAAKGFGTLLSELIKQAFFSKSETPNKFNAKNFEAHFSATFDRCTRVKTLVSGEEAVSLLEQYINIKFSYFKKQQFKEIEDYDLIDLIRKEGKIVVSGTAGGGKTVFMKYLWVSLFVEPLGIVPIYLELRRINDFTSADIISYIHYNIMMAEDESGIETFRQALKDGKFALVFDGFDEVAIGRRKQIENQILDISQRYPKSIIVVSGRPDDRFNTWQGFTKFNVKSMDKEQVVELVKRVSFDETIKTKFIEALDKDLYEKHQSFLSAPLLTLMMLITFKHHADIPAKIHVFYSKAFETLYSLHDATKEAFNREKNSGFSVDLFRRRLSCLCMITYIDQKFEFVENELLDYISKSGRIDDVKFSSEAFLKDLMEAVCVLQKDGLQVVFSHRSFQEYFTAVFLDKLAPDKLNKILPRLCERASDQVVTMLFDMNKEVVEETYILPMSIRENIRFAVIDKSSDLAAICHALEYRVSVNLSDGNVVRTSGDYIGEDNELRDFRNVVTRLYPKIFGPLSQFDRYYASDREVYKDFPSKCVGKTLDMISVSLSCPKGEWVVTTQLRDESEQHLSAEAASEVVRWFEGTGHARYLRDHSRFISRAIDQIPKAHRKREKELIGLLGIGI